MPPDTPPDMPADMPLGTSARPTEDALRLDLDALAAFLGGVFPPETRPAYGTLVALAPGHARLRLDPTPAMVRPGNIVSGPTLMGLADFAAYAIVLGHVGPVAMAVTTSLHATFLRACRLAPVVADARLLKLGRTLATVDVRLWQGRETRPVAHATVGYALP